MKFTLSWLRDYLHTPLSAAELADKLTSLGLEVESVTDLGAQLADFIVAIIEDATPHPSADKLRVCQVFDGTTTRQIVCGAPNARAGIHVVLAREGVYIPGNGMTIKKTSIRGVESHGMLCSLEELNLPGDSSGIVELSNQPEPGTAAARALGLDDVVFDIAITPNRGDCFSVYGIARDLAAAGTGELKPPMIPNIPLQAAGGGASPVQLVNQTTSCQQLSGIAIRGVTNQDSPAWLRQRLEIIGQKSISALVDITNYIMLTFGRPLHAYDMRFVRGNITARNARPGEAFTALNGQEYQLNESMVVIADDAGVLGLAGITGGEASGCRSDTRDVFIESAVFDAVSIAKTGQQLTITSEARMRFERGADPSFVENGALLAASMIQALCGGEISALTVAENHSKKESKQLTFNPELVNQLTSIHVAPDAMKSALERLGIHVKMLDNNQAWQLTIPPWRHDISIAQDIVEEVARLSGYDAIAPIALPAANAAPATPPLNVVRLAAARRLLASAGLIEQRNWSFVSEAQASQCSDLNPELFLANPISSELAVMRSHLLPHLMASAQRNFNHGAGHVAIFECGQIFTGTRPEQQHWMVAALLSGKRTSYLHGSEQFSARQECYSLYDAKTHALSLLTQYGIIPEQLSFTAEAPAYYHPGRSMRISLGGKITLGYAGELHPSLSDSYDLGPSAACELWMDNIPAPKAKATAKKPLHISPFQSVMRDFAFTAAADIHADDIRRAALRADKKLIQHAEIFDVYQGSHMEAGKKSIALRVCIQPSDKTLTDEEIQAICTSIIEQVSTATGASLRS